MHELTGVAFSHYVEKARWALDRYGVPYSDHRVMPFFHLWFVFRIHGGRAGRSDRASSRFSTPVLKTPGGQLLCDSGAIVAYVSEHFASAANSLDAGPDGRDFEQRLHDRLGPHTRRVAYSAMFERPAVLSQMAHENVSAVQAKLFSPLVPVAQAGMHRLMDISDSATARSLDVIRGELDVVADHLSDGRRWLMGDRFTSVDLSYACMMAPGVLPPEYSAWLPSLDQLSARIVEPVREFRAHPAGQFALRAFAEERRRVVGLTSG